MALNTQIVGYVEEIVRLTYTFTA